MTETAGASGASDTARLQAYVDGNAALHDALGVPRETALPLIPYAQGEYNINYLIALSPSAQAAVGAGGGPVGAGRGSAGAGGAGGGSDGEDPAGHGDVSSVFTADDVILRVNMGSQMHLDQQIDYEARALRLLESSGRVPRVLYVDGSRSVLPQGVLVEQFLPGRSLDYSQDMAEATRILADIHATPVPEGADLVCPADPLGSVVDECADMFAVYLAWSGAQDLVKEQVGRYLDRARRIAADEHRHRPLQGHTGQARRHIINTELNSSNFRIGAPGARSYLIDWEKPVLGEPAQDLGHFLVPTTTFWKTDTILNRTQMEQFLDCYEQAVAGRFDTTDIRARFDRYLKVNSVRGLTWCAMALTQYLGDSGRALSNADTLEKIQAYLSPDFLDFIGAELFSEL